MASRCHVKKIFLFLLISISLATNWWSTPLRAMAAIPSYALSIGARALQQIALFIGATLYYAANHQLDSLVAHHISQQQPTHTTAYPSTPHQESISLINALDTIRQTSIPQSQPVASNVYSLPLITIFEQHRKNNISSVVYSSLERILQPTAPIPAEISHSTTKQLSLEEMRSAANAAFGTTNSLQTITKQAEQRMALQSRLGLMNFHGIILSAGEAADGHMTYYVGLKEKRSCEIRADMQTSQWLARRQVEEILAHDAEFRTYVFNQYKTAIAWMYAANDASAIKRIRARLMLPGLIFEGNNWQEFYLAAHKLQTYFFTRNGALCSIGRTNIVQPLMHNLMLQVQKTWPTINIGIDAEKTNLLDDQLTDKPWALWFAPNISEFSERIIKNPENQLVLKVLDACEQGNLALAESLYKKAEVEHMPHAQELAREIIEEARALLFDAYGFNKTVQFDPLYKQLTEQEKIYLKLRPAELELINTSLLLRHNLKRKFQQAWNIADTAPQAVHNALYALLDNNAHALSNVPVLIDKLIELTADYHNSEQPILLATFFLQNGMLKDFAHYPRAKKLSLPAAIMNIENLPLRRILNNLAYIEHTMANTSQGIDAGKILDFIEKRFATHIPDVRHAYDNIIYQSYNALTQHQTPINDILLNSILNLSNDTHRAAHPIYVDEFFLANGIATIFKDISWAQELKAIHDLRSEQATTLRFALNKLLHAYTQTSDPLLQEVLKSTCQTLVTTGSQHNAEIWHQTILWHNMHLLHNVLSVQEKDWLHHMGLPLTSVTIDAGKHIIPLLTRKNIEIPVNNLIPWLKNLVPWAQKQNIAIDNLVALQEALIKKHSTAIQTPCMPMPDPGDPDDEKKSSIKSFLELLKNSAELKELEKIVEELSKKLDDTKVRTRMPNEISASEYVKIEATAENLFEHIRNTTSDVTKIAKNTGIPTKIIQAIKDHVFYEDHILDEGIRRFHANIDMADAWMRLINNNFIKSDLALLMHEYAELLIMDGQKIAYSTAHFFVNNLYNWEKLILL